MITEKLNAVTKPTQFRLPRLEDIFDSIGQSNATIFSVSNCASGFYQIKMDPETAHKSAFITQDGVWQRKRMPFCLCNAPASFQLVMSQAVRNMNWSSVVVYIDDILCFSKNFEEHLIHLNQVFACLRKAGSLYFTFGPLRSA